MPSHEQVLITGATGFLGGAVLHQCLSGNSPIRWLALVRGATEAEARQKLVGRMSRFAGHAEAGRLVARVEILLGSLENFKDIDPSRLANVSRILHLAADTSFSAKSSPWRINFDGTVGLAECARRLPRLIRFVYVSTATICGAEPPLLVPEECYPSIGVDHLVEYTRSKAATEMILRERFADLPIVVARPSIVVGHSRMGVRPSSSIFWFIRFAESLGLIPGDPDYRIDIVPVDWVASCLVELSFRSELAHDVYHLSAGVGSSTTWRRLADRFAALRGSGRIGQLEPVNLDLPEHLDLLRTRTAERLGYHGRSLRLITRAAQSYYRFCELDVVFDNSRLLQEGIAGPPSFSDYLGVCLASAPGASILEQFMDDAEMFDNEAEVPANVLVAAEQNSLITEV